MRVPSFAHYQNLTRHLQNSQQAINERQDQLSTGVKIAVGSDDPIAYQAVQRLSLEGNKIERYIETINTTDDRLNRTELALVSIENQWLEVKDTALALVNGRLSDEDKQAYRQVLSAAKENLLGIANTQDRYGQSVFSGTADVKMPFVVNNDDVVYQGNTEERRTRIGDDRQVSSHLNGDHVFLSVPTPQGDRFSMFDSLDNLMAFAQSDLTLSENAAQFQSEIERVDQAFEHIVSLHSQVGVSRQQLASQKAQHESFHSLMEQEKSQLAAVDFSEAVIDLNQHMLSVQAAQLAFGKTQNLSLFNYL